MFCLDENFDQLIGGHAIQMESWPRLILTALVVANIGEYFIVSELHEVFHLNRIELTVG